MEKQTRQQPPKEGSKSSELENDLNFVIDLRPRLQELPYLLNFGMFFLFKFKDKFTNEFVNAKDTFDYLKLMDISMKQSRKRGANVIEFGQLSSWKKRVSVFSYYLYGEILSESELIRRLDERRESDFYMLDNAGSAFALIHDMAHAKGVFTFKELLTAFRQWLQEMKSEFGMIHGLAPTEEGELEPKGMLDLSGTIADNPDLDVGLLKRAVDIALGKIPPKASQNKGPSKESGISLLPTLTFAACIGAIAFVGTSLLAWYWHIGPNEVWKELYEILKVFLSQNSLLPIDLGMASTFTGVSGILRNAKDKTEGLSHASKIAGESKGLNHEMEETIRRINNLHREAYWEFTQPKPERYTALVDKAAQELIGAVKETSIREPDQLRLAPIKYKGILTRFLGSCVTGDAEMKKGATIILAHAMRTDPSLVPVVLEGIDRLDFTDMKNGRIHLRKSGPYKWDYQEDLDGFLALLKDDNELRKLLLALSLLRLAFPNNGYDMGSLTPLEYVKEHSYLFPYKGFRVTPMSGSFRRHLIVLTGRSGKEHVIELKIPGQEKDRDLIHANHFGWTQKFYYDDYVRAHAPVALAMVTTTGKYVMYHWTRIFTKDNPLRIVVFDYEDGVRFARAGPKYFDRVAKSLELPAADPMIKLIVLARRMLKKGLRGYSERGNDWHLENFKLTPKGKVLWVGDAGAFEKTSEPLSEDEIEEEIARLLLVGSPGRLDISSFGKVYVAACNWELLISFFANFDGDRQKDVLALDELIKILDKQKDLMALKISQYAPIRFFLEAIGIDWQKYSDFEPIQELELETPSFEPIRGLKIPDFSMIRLNREQAKVVTTHLFKWDPDESHVVLIYCHKQMPIAIGTSIDHETRRYINLIPTLLDTDKPDHNQLNELNNQLKRLEALLSIRGIDFQEYEGPSPFGWAESKRRNDVPKFSGVWGTLTYADSLLDVLWRECEAHNLPSEGMDALDLGTGTGIVADTLADWGFDVDAVDIDPIAVANAKATTQGKNVQVWQSDAFSQVTKRYDVITLVAPTVRQQATRGGDVKTEDAGGKFMRSLLEGLPEHLKLGGRFYLGIDTTKDLESLLKEFEDKLNIQIIAKPNHIVHNWTIFEITTNSNNPKIASIPSPTDNVQAKDGLVASDLKGSRTLTDQISVLSRIVSLVLKGGILKWLPKYGLVFAGMILLGMLFWGVPDLWSQVPDGSVIDHSLLDRVVQINPNPQGPIPGFDQSQTSQMLMGLMPALPAQKQQDFFRIHSNLLKAMTAPGQAG